ncbi:MAG: N-glycosylase [Defluviitaleaceae bacterium]|nr:N-glycosylase [Defluviitaleaceae bacterium]
MEITTFNDKIKITNLRQFNIGEVLECGQCFRFEKLDNNFYSLVAFSHTLFAKQRGDAAEFWYENRKLDIEEFKEIWVDYFDLERDYEKIQQKIAQDDPIMQRAVEFAPGIRLLNQDPWEILLSFIISANNRIPQIKQVIKNICEAYGENSSFPTPEQLKNVTAEDFRVLKTGFRDKYLVDAVAHVLAGNLPIQRDESVSTADLRERLLAVKGIGEKVAHCILLMGYGRYNSFPVDVWVQRVMERLYFNGEKTSVAKIHQFAGERWGDYASFANQYLFHYIRMNPEAD